MFPDASVATALAASVDVPPKFVTQNKSPALEYFATNASAPPMLVRVVPLKIGEAPTLPTMQTLPSASTAMPPNVSALKLPLERTHSSCPAGSYLARNISAPFPPATLPRMFVPNTALPLKVPAAYMLPCASIARLRPSSALVPPALRVHKNPGGAVTVSVASVLLVAPAMLVACTE